MGPNLLFGGGPVRASPSQFGLTLITSATCTRLWAIKAHGIWQLVQEEVLGKAA